MSKTSVDVSSVMFTKWCVNWAEIDVTKSKDENPLQAGMFEVLEEDVDGKTESVLKL